MSIDVLSMGVITMDTIALVEKYPSADERVLAKLIVRAGGGPAAVAAVALARLGMRSAIVGTVGDDDDGQEILRIFEREGVDATGVSIGCEETSGSIIVVAKEQATRAISSRQVSQEVPINKFARNLAKTAKWIHVDHVGITRLSELGISRGGGPKISFDAGYEIEGFDSSAVDLFAPPARQLALRQPGLSIEVGIKNEAEAGKNVVVATMGGNGSIAYSDGIISRAEGVKIEILSTLGAGDVFHGALLAQLLQGREMKNALARANAVAAMSCRGLDGQSAIPTEKELNDFMSESAHE